MTTYRAVLLAAAIAAASCGAGTSTAQPTDPGDDSTPSTASTDSGAAPAEADRPGSALPSSWSAHTGGIELPCRVTLFHHQQLVERDGEYEGGNEPPPDAERAVVWPRPAEIPAWVEPEQLLEPPPPYSMPYWEESELDREHMGFELSYQFEEGSDRARYARFCGCGMVEQDHYWYLYEYEC